MVVVAQCEEGQRRKFFRKKVALPVEAWLFGLPDGSELPKDRRIAATVTDLSGCGLLLEAHPSNELLLQVSCLTEATSMLSRGALVDLSIELPHERLPLRILARVVRVEETSSESLSFALEFVLLTRQETDRIVGLVSS